MRCRGSPELPNLRTAKLRQTGSDKVRRRSTLWMEESHDHIVRDGEELLRIQSYIRANPEEAKLAHDEYRMHEAEYELKQ